MLELKASKKKYLNWLLIEDIKKRLKGEETYVCELKRLDLEENNLSEEEFSVM